MSDQERRILEELSKTIPNLTYLEKEKFIAFCEGMSAMVNLNDKKEREAVVKRYTDEYYKQVQVES